MVQARAVTLGFYDGEHMASDPDLMALHGNSAFEAAVEVNVEDT